ncbi:hypothetical protein DOK78_002065 [Enterococcus sp. DIV2402]|uniref:Uncharacterized protein n=1 Tax=Candidatus Enterococcus lowellii TaxID=2230877 RepID=A0ABZ2SPH9_9ENTE
MRNDHYKNKMNTKNYIYPRFSVAHQLYIVIMLGYIILLGFNPTIYLVILLIIGIVGPFITLILSRVQFMKTTTDYYGPEYVEHVSRLTPNWFYIRTNCLVDKQEV